MEPLVEKKFWRADWDKEQQRDINDLALYYLHSGQARDKRAAWMTAEEQFGGRQNQRYRNVMRRQQ